MGVTTESSSIVHTDNGDNDWKDVLPVLPRTEDELNNMVNSILFEAWKNKKLNDVISYLNRCF